MTIHSKPQLPERPANSPTTEQSRASITAMAATSLTPSIEDRAEKVDETFVISSDMVDIDSEGDDDFTKETHHKHGTSGLYATSAEIKSNGEIGNEIGNVISGAPSLLMQPRSGEETIASNSRGDHTSSTIDLHLRGMEFFREVETGSEGRTDGNDPDGHGAVVTVAANANGLNNHSNDEESGPRCNGCIPETVVQPIKDALRYIRKTDFRWVKFSQFLCALYILVVTFSDVGAFGFFGGARDPATGFIIDASSMTNTQSGIIEFHRLGASFTRAIVAQDTLQMVLLGVSRFSGFFMYPSLVLVVFSKMRALNACLATTPLSVYLISDLHELHVYAGWIIMVDATIHTSFHLSRWFVQSNLSLLWTHPSGISGLIAILCCLVIVLPMTDFPFITLKKGTKDEKIISLRRLVPYEFRKTIHTILFWGMFMVLAFHAPLRALPNAGFSGFVFPAIALTYAIDCGVCYFVYAEMIPTMSYLYISPDAVQLSFQPTQRWATFLPTGGYCYIAVPWLRGSNRQWHCFSVFELPDDPGRRHVLIADLGDWTKCLRMYMESVQHTVRPIWIMGPFPSPYNNALRYDNLVLVAAGIGITPAISAIEAYRDSRRVCLVWSIRQLSLLLHFIKVVGNKVDGIRGFVLITYTGVAPLPEAIANIRDMPWLRIVRTRKPMKNVIPNTIALMQKGMDPCSHNTSASDRLLVEGANSDHKEIGPFIWSKSNESRDFVKHMSRMQRDMWGILYCGGKNPLLVDLIDQAKELKIKLHQESFAW